MNKEFLINEYNKLITFYQQEIELIKQHKPYFFQFKKRKIYKQQISDYEHKILDLYKSIEEELDN